MASNLTAFCNQLENLLLGLHGITIKILDSDNDKEIKDSNYEVIKEYNKKLEDYLVAFKLLRKTNPRELLNLFKEFVYDDYHKDIKEGNFDEILKTDVTKKEDHYGHQGMIECLKVQELFLSGKLSEKSKDSIKKYMKVLVVLCERCF